MWITWILSNWRTVVILSLIGALGVSMSLGAMYKSQRDEKIAVIESMRIEAENYAERSQKIARQINEHSETLVAQAKKDAYANYLAKYGRGNAACGLRLPTGTHEASSPGEPDATGTDPVADPIRETVEQCAVTTSMVVQWQDWAMANELPIEN